MNRYRPSPYYQENNHKKWKQKQRSEKDTEKT
jgi:hypothetical protein